MVRVYNGLTMRKVGDLPGRYIQGIGDEWIWGIWPRQADFPLRASLVSLNGDIVVVGTLEDPPPNVRVLKEIVTSPGGDPWTTIRIGVSGNLKPDRQSIAYMSRLTLDAVERAMAANRQAPRHPKSRSRRQATRYLRDPERYWITPQTRPREKRGNPS